MIMEVREETAGVERLTLLPLPSLDVLTEQQVRGQACVWDAVPLSGIPAVDLGPRTATRAGESVSWFPRADRACVAVQAHRALLDHAPGCEQCVDEASKCEIGRGLYRLIREHRR